MRKVTVHAAKTQLSELIEAALAGEEVVIAKGDKPVVRLVAIPQGQFKLGVSQPGALGDGPDFFSPMDEDELRRGRVVADDAPARRLCLGVVANRRLKAARAERARLCAAQAWNSSPNSSQLSPLNSASCFCRIGL